MPSFVLPLERPAAAPDFASVKDIAKIFTKVRRSARRP
jgi:hypothetical protein